MKNIFMKVMSYSILSFIIFLLIFGGVKMQDKSNLNKEFATTLISEESTTFSEIEKNEEVTSSNIKMTISFEDKLKTIQTVGQRPTSLSIDTTEIKPVEKVKKPSQQQKSQSTITTTTTISLEELEEEITELEEEIVEYEEKIEEDIEEIEEIVEEIHYASSDKYPNAAIVWNYLRDLGYNKAVCAGILGNMMAEVGGHTLALQPKLYGGGYYGLCQWSTSYYPSVSGTDIYTQLNFLANTIRKEMNNFGYKYYSGFNYEAFLNLTDPGAVAKAFAMCYERCASWSYGSRASNAYTAYEYFA